MRLRAFWSHSCQAACNVHVRAGGASVYGRKSAVSCVPTLRPQMPKAARMMDGVHE